MTEAEARAAKKVVQRMLYTVLFSNVVACH
jgi:hypothetical protein